MLDEKDWDILLRRIKKGQCTPFLGCGACSEKNCVSSKIANEWAKEYDYPMEDFDNLTRVAQFVAVTVDPMTPKDEMCEKIKELSEEVTPSFFKTPDEIHGVLASLPLPVYISTTYDDLMEQALKSSNKEPIQKICRWNDCFMKCKQISADFDPTPEKPLVYHLNGCYEEPASLVLTEEDYLDFLVAVSKDQNLIPPRIQEAFGGTSLLLLGYKVTDWDFRVLCRILAEYLEKSQRKHISVQLVPGNVSEDREKKAQQYLDRYFDDLHIQVYWHDCCDFASELRNRWEAFNRGIIIKDTVNINGIAGNHDPIKIAPLPVNNDWFKKEFLIPGQIKAETNVISILFLAADPTDAARLQLGKEFREIQEKLKLAKLWDRFKLEIPQFSVRSLDITQALFDTKPQIVHFSGHGTPTGELYFEDQEGKSNPVEPDSLAELFEQFSGQVSCVVLNACYSEIQAKAIAKYIEYVIGMNQEIDDKAAIAFSTGFYQALGGGRNIEGAYKFGCLQIQLQNIPGHLTPVLIKRDSAIAIMPNNKD